VSIQIRIGISGWRYAGWRGVFYPQDLAQRRELEFASRHFNSIEINGSFYSLQDAASWQKWHNETPRDFLFAVKCPRFISHIKRLRDIEAPLANFFASGVLLLRRKLGPLLWQFPPNMVFDAQRWEAFFRLLPKTMAAAARQAAQHDQRIDQAALPETIPRRPLLHAMEIRHESFRCEEFIALLRKYGIALVVADTAGKFPYLEDVTADFVYLRLHGAEVLYASGYDDNSLKRWAKRIALWSAGAEPRDAQRASSSKPEKAPRSVYCYFDNDAKVRAPFDAQRLSTFIERAMNGRG
jgi:uncharacterized protein YecE (DUF72 family)